jgi:hypothetical protein
MTASDDGTGASSRMTASRGAIIVVASTHKETSDMRENAEQYWADVSDEDVAAALDEWDRLESNVQSGAADIGEFLLYGVLSNDEFGDVLRDEAERRGLVGA